MRAAMKPIATVPRALPTVDVTTGEAANAHHQRSDVCAVPAAGVVAEPWPHWCWLSARWRNLAGIQ
ncbi:chorismate synthase [Cutibacterium acnes JCM 18918]|nr:chorismate synthase [Cutibacterium acnes JCM 18918]